MPATPPSAPPAPAPPPPSSDSNSPILLPLPSPHLSLSKTRFSSWYPILKKVSQKARILDLVQLTAQQDGSQLNGFLDWYESDGIVLPKGSDRSSTPPLASPRPGEEQNLDGDESEEEDQDEPDWRFDDLNAKVRQVIAKYDGAVFPKLDWSAPRDASFLLPGNNLRCVMPSDVYLLLKGSDFVSKDIEQLKELEWQSQDSDSPSQVSEGANTSSEPDSNPSNQRRALHLHLILKPHLNIPTSNEFRCFVRSNQLIAICQRDSIYFHHLNEGDPHGSLRCKIKRMITDFWLKEMGGQELRDDSRKSLKSAGKGKGKEKEKEKGDHLENVSHKLAETSRDAEQEQEPDPKDQQTQKGGEKGPVGLSSYIFDIYLTRDYGKAFIMDINPWLERTDPLLWEWQELEELAQKRVEKEWEIHQRERGAGVADSIRIPIGKNEDGGAIEKGEKVASDGEGEGESESESESESAGADADAEGSDDLDEDQDEDDQGFPMPVLRLVSNPTATATARASPSSNSSSNPTSTSTMPPPTVLPTQSTPTYSTNMVPADFLQATAGMSLVQAAEEWERRLRDSTLREDDDDEESESEPESG